jgi:hypothetical protein
MTTRQIPDSRHETPPPDPRLVEVALRCGDHSAAVLESLVTGTWDWVDELPDVDLTGQVDVRLVA